MGCGRASPGPSVARTRYLLSLGVEEGVRSRCEGVGHIARQCTSLPKQEGQVVATTEARALGNVVPPLFRAEQRRGHFMAQAAAL